MICVFIIADVEILLEGEKAEKRLALEHKENLKAEAGRLKAELTDVQDKLRRKQASFLQLQAEKDSVVEENR